MIDDTAYVRGGLELNGPSTIQALLQLFETGVVSKDEFLERLKETNQVMYDYLVMLKMNLDPDAHVKCWHVVREASLKKRKTGDYIVQD